MRIGIYNHQHLRGGCPGCSQIYVKGMIKDSLQCQSRATSIFGEGCEFFNYTDLGDYPSTNLNRPGYRRMMRDVEEGKLDAIFVLTLSKISTDLELVLATFRQCKQHNVFLYTAVDGEKAMKVLNEALKKWEKK